MAVKTPVVSTLNPDAPLFVPAAYVAAEDFSPEWWRLIQTSPAFRDYWLRERFCGMDEDAGAEEINEVVDDYLEFEREIEEMEAETEIVHVKSENGPMSEADQLVVKDGEGKDSKKGVRPDPVKQFDRVPQKFVNNPRKAAYRIQQPRAT